jgi:hypothetical protein
LLLLAENLADQRFVAVSRHFVGSGLVRSPDVPRFTVAARRAVAMRDSWSAEVVMIGLAVLVAASVVAADLRSGLPTWRVVEHAGTRSISLAGWWALVVAQPIFVLVLLRWVWRLIIWAVFLWRVARLDLALAAAHPDGAGGLGFLSATPQVFGIVVFAQSVLLASVWGDLYFHQGVDPRTHIPAFVAFVVLNVLVYLAPLLVFTGPLARLRRTAAHRYSALGTREARLFEDRWLATPQADEAGLLESPEPSALADFSSVFGNVTKMKVVPFGLQTAIGLVVAAALPMLPLATAVVPLPQLLAQLAKALL